MHINTLLGRFEAVSEDAEGYLARCPAHTDGRPSLRIWHGDDGKVRLTCRAGCTPDAVVSAAGLTYSDLFNVQGNGPRVPAAPPSTASDSHIAQLAAYIERRAQALFSSETGDAAKEYARRRFGVDYDLAAELRLGADCDNDPYAGDSFAHRSKSFRRFARLTVPLYDFEGVARGLQGRDISGECPARWVSLNNPKGHRWSAYGVFRGHGGYSATVVTEGPGDALSVVAVGYDSVAVRGASLAAGKELLSELARGLAGTQVVVCGDADRAGRGFAEKLSKGLSAHGLTVYTLTLPQGFSDLSEWQEAAPERFAAELHNAVAAARPLAEAERHSASTELARRTGAHSASADEGSEAARVLAELVERYGESDAMNAYALVAFSNGCIRYTPGLGFYVWNGHVWEPSETKVRQAVHQMGAALVLAGKLHEAKGFTMTTRIDALLTELRSVPSVLADVDDFDAQPHLLSFANGTVDLRSGVLRPHDKADMLTRILDFDYNPSARAERWETFLAEIFDAEPDLVGYMQRLAGYGITGSTDEQCFAVLYGSGANGKSVFTDTLSSVFGAVTKTTRFATFEKRATGSIPNDIANLRGARLVMSSEGSASREMDEEGLKSMTGKDRVQARFLHREWFEYRPTFLIMLATNHRPNFRSQDEGLWRRVKLIPFARYFAPAERDYQLDRKLRAEHEGIAAWAVRGAVEWYAGGLRDPECIRGATRDFRETSDALSGFYPGVVMPAEGSRVSGAQAYIEYRAWCDEEGLSGSDVKTRTMFYRMMEERGVSKKRTAEGITLDGVCFAKDRSSVAGPGIFKK